MSPAREPSPAQTQPGHSAIRPWGLFVVTVPDEIAERARGAIDRIVAIS